MASPLTARVVSANQKMKSLALIFVSLLAVYSINCEVYFEEKFPDGKCRILFYSKCRTLVSRRLAACAIISIGSVSAAGLFWVLFYVKRDNLSLQTRGNPSGCTVSTLARSSANSS